jgi:hypothetical protein
MTSIFILFLWSKMTEKKDIEYFINKHYRLITTMGVFGALTAYLSQLQGFADLASITFIIFIFLTWELFIKFPDASKSTLKLISLSLLVGILLVGVALLVLVKYVSKYYALFTLAFSFGIYSLLASKVSQRLRLFERLQKRINEKHYETVQMFVLLGIIVLVFVLGIFTANYVVSWIQNIFNLPKLT